MGKTKERTVGDIGEGVAVKYLKKHGFSVLECNYLKKYGEIDVIAKKNSDLHFVEVKTVSRENYGDVSRGTVYRPEQNVDRRKLERMNRAIQVYLEEKDISETVEWQIDVVGVVLDQNTRRAKVTMLENVIFE